MPIMNAQFTRDPVGFLTTHALAFDTAGAVAGLNQWVIERDADFPPATLRLARPADAHTFTAYFLPYTAGASHQLMLGNMADIMFTPPLTGCTFVIENRWYTPMVSHHNRLLGTGGIDQPTIDTAVTGLHGAATTPRWHSITANYYPVRKDDYVPPGADAQNHRLHVVGVRGLLGWYMYRMKHDVGNDAVVEAPSRIN